MKRVPLRRVGATSFAAEHSGHLPSCIGVSPQRMWRDALRQVTGRNDGQGRGSSCLWPSTRRASQATDMDQKICGGPAKTKSRTATASLSVLLNKRRSNSHRRGGWQWALQRKCSCSQLSPCRRRYPAAKSCTASTSFMLTPPRYAEIGGRGIALIQSELKAETKLGTFPGRALMGILMAGAGIGLIYALFRTFGATGADFMEALSRSPWQLYAAVTIILMLNNLVGVLKWRAAIRWLDPAAAMPPVVASFEASIFGSLFGLLLLPQVTSAAARWVVLKRNGVRGSLAVSTTFYEQVCDVFMLTTAGIAGLVILLFTPEPMAGGLLVVAAFATALVTMRPVFAAGAVLFAGIRRLLGPGRIAGALGTFAEVLRRLAAAPWRASLTMMSYSALRLALQIGHGLAIAFVFAPTAAPTLVAAGVPAGVLAAALPISPSGLGVADWTWGGMLVLAGATPIAAAVATLASRVAYAIALGAVGGALLFVRLFRGVLVS